MPITAGSGDSGPVYCDTYSAITASWSKSDFDIATRSKRAPHRVQYVDYFFQREPAVLQIDTIPCWNWKEEEGTHFLFLTGALWSIPRWKFNDFILYHLYSKWGPHCEARNTSNNPYSWLIKTSWKISFSWFDSISFDLSGSKNMPWFSPMFQLFSWFFS